MTATVTALTDHKRKEEQLMNARNAAIRAAKEDSVPAAAISRWIGVSEAHVRRIGRGDTEPTT